MTKKEINKERKKLLNFFSKLKFNEEKHEYSVDGKTLPSVSSLLKNFYEEFEKEKISYNYALKHSFSQEDVLSAWDGENKKSTTEGSRVHLFGEDFATAKYFANATTPLPMSKQDLGIIQWWIDCCDSVPYIIPLVLELQMYNLELGYAGTADIILLDTRDNSLILADYKTNKELFNNFGGKKLKLPKQDLLDDNFNKYQLQLSFYQIQLEEMGYKVKARILVWLNEKDGKLYQNFYCKDYTKELRQWLSNH